MIEVIEQTIDRAKLDHDLIVPITRQIPRTSGVFDDFCFYGNKEGFT